MSYSSNRMLASMVINDAKSTPASTPSKSAAATNFTYEQLKQCDKVQNKTLPGKDYSAWIPLTKQAGSPHFVYVQDNREPKGDIWDEEYQKATDQRRVTKGYKFHISIDDSKKDNNLAKGWDLIKDILIKHDVYMFKVIRDASRDILHKDPEQNGKEITVYAFKENRSAADWKVIIQEITNVLTQNNIKPGPLAPSETAINGTNYVSCRSDGGDQNNPYANMQIISPAGQLERVSHPASAPLPQAHTALQVEDTKAGEIDWDNLADNYQRAKPTGPK